MYPAKRKRTIYPKLEYYGDFSNPHIESTSSQTFQIEEIARNHSGTIAPVEPLNNELLDEEADLQDISGDTQFEDSMNCIIHSEDGANYQCYIQDNSSDAQLFDDSMTCKIHSEDGAPILDQHYQRYMQMKVSDSEAPERINIEDEEESSSSNPKSNEARPETPTKEVGSDSEAPETINIEDEEESSSSNPKSNEARPETPNKEVGSDSEAPETINIEDEEESSSNNPTDNEARPETATKDVSSFFMDNEARPETATKDMKGSASEAPEIINIEDEVEGSSNNHTNNEARPETPTKEMKGSDSEAPERINIEDEEEGSSNYPTNNEARPETPTKEMKGSDSEAPELINIEVEEKGSSNNPKSNEARPVTPTKEASSGDENNLKVGSLVFARLSKRGKMFAGILIPRVPAVANYMELDKHYIYWFFENTISEVPDTKNIISILQQVNLNAISKKGVPQLLQCIDQIYGTNTTDIKDTAESIAWICSEKDLLKHNECIPKPVIAKVEDINNQFFILNSQEEHVEPKASKYLRKSLIPYKLRKTLEICLGCRQPLSNANSHPLIDGNCCIICLDRITRGITCNELTASQNETDLIAAKNGNSSKSVQWIAIGKKGGSLKMLLDPIMTPCVICGWNNYHIRCKNCIWVVCIDCVYFWYAEDKLEKYVLKENQTIEKCIMCWKHPGQKVTKLRRKSSVNYKTYLRSSYRTNHKPEISKCDWSTRSNEIIHGVGEGRTTPLRVLSLFDGISTGKVVLSQLGIKVEAYFASEIDKMAINVSRANHGDAVKQIGAVENINSQTIKQYLPIHLLIGGSPCTDLSGANTRRKGLTDLSGTGKLYFEFFRVMKLLEPNTFYFLFENVPMKTEYKDMISRFFEVEPVAVDSQHVSPMRRKRLFWGNTPELKLQSKIVEREIGVGKNFQSCLTPNLQRKALVGKIRTVTTNKNSLTRTDGSSQVEMNGEPSEPSTTELEQVFGFEPHYTDVLNLTNKDRKNLLGRAWSVPCLKAILEPLAYVFKKDEDD